jgi:2-polyprenyl-3-methyl-5-hydroxy-6-metoxy-1,4-benzoquinol methylase
VCKYDKIFVKKGKDYLRCRECGLIIADPLPSHEEIKRYYDADYDRDEGMGTARTVAEFLFHATAQSRLPQIGIYCESGRWLDVGCANGAFLEVIVASGYDGYGIDLSVTAVAVAVSKGLQVQAATIETCNSDTPYDVVSAFDVIEHTLNPVSFVQAARDLLKPGGIFVLTTPDTSSIMARVMGSRWYHYIPEIHFFNFNRRNITRLLEINGFDVIRTTRAKKYLNFNYGQIQFKEYNPLIYTVLRALGILLPSRARELPISFYIGEMLIIAKRTKG